MEGSHIVLFFGTKNTSSSYHRRMEIVGPPSTNKIAKSVCMSLI